MALGKLKTLKIILSVAVAVILVVAICGAFNIVTNSISSSLSGFLNGNERKEALKNVPEEFRNNYFFKFYGLGECESLAGDICVTFVFVDDDLNEWTTEEIESYKAEAQKVLYQIETDSKEYDVNLNFKAEYKTAVSSGELTVNNHMSWIRKAIESAGLPNFSNLGEKLEKEYGVDNAPVIFCVNRDGRCFAKPSSAKRKGEVAVIYNNPKSLYHELCHIFGARDFYYPDEIKILAEEKLPNSIMNANGEEIDDLTAYLIGWTKNLSSDATAFLENTNHITDDIN